MYVPTTHYFLLSQNQIKRLRKEAGEAREGIHVCSRKKMILASLGRMALIILSIVWRDLFLFRAKGEKVIIPENVKRGWDMGEHIIGTSLPNDAGIIFFLDQIVHIYDCRGGTKRGKSRDRGARKKYNFIHPKCYLIFSSNSRIIQISIEEWKRQNDFYPIIFFNINIFFYPSWPTPLKS